MSRVSKLQATHDGQAKYQGFSLYELLTKIIINAQALVAKYRCVVIGGLLFVGLGIHKIFVLNRSGREMHSSQPLIVLALHTSTTIRELHRV